MKYLPLIPITLPPVDNAAAAWVRVSYPAPGVYLVNDESIAFVNDAVVVSIVFIGTGAFPHATVCDTPPYEPPAPPADSLEVDARTPEGIRADTFLTALAIGIGGQLAAREFLDKAK